MIHNQKQLTVAEKEIKALRDSIQSLEGSDSIMDRLQRSAWQSLLEDLRAEVWEFRSLQNKHFLTFDTINLSKAIMSIRIASGVTQKALAEAIGVKEQQIQRYEQQEYLTASFERIIQILKVLSCNITLTAELRLRSKHNFNLPANKTREQIEGASTTYRKKWMQTPA